MTNINQYESENGKSAKLFAIVTLIIASFTTAVLLSTAIIKERDIKPAPHFSIKHMLRKRLEYPNYIIIKKGNAKTIKLKC